MYHPALMRKAIRLGLLVVLIVLVISSCAGGGGGGGGGEHVIEGKFGVGDYKLYMRCEGSVSPTVVYLHGFIEQPPSGASSADEIPSMLRDEHRICVYDRANIGRSDDVPGPACGQGA